MAIVKFLKSIYTGADTTAVGELEAADTATLPCPVDMNDKELLKPLVRDYAMKANAVTSSAGTLTLDMTTGNEFTCALSENITTLTISNPPAGTNVGELVVRFTQDSTGRSITYAAAYKADGGALPQPSSGSGAIDVFLFRTNDAGTTWYVKKLFEAVA